MRHNGAFRKRRLRQVRRTTAAILLAFLLAACGVPAPPTPVRQPGVAGAPASAPTSAPSPAAGTSRGGESIPTSEWLDLLARTPFPYTTPLPPAVTSPLDGTYVRTDPRTGTRVPCRRCPPYPPEGGLWKLQLDQGIFRVYHPATAWRSLGSFTTDGDRLAIFNDPHCYGDTGVYRARRVGTTLLLETIEDVCGGGLRASSLSQQAWESCQPPGTESAVTGHWPVPAGCSVTD